MDGFGGTATQRLGQEDASGVFASSLVDQAPPKRGGHLVGAVAAETFDSKISQELNDTKQILKQALFVLGVFVIELRQVFPHHLLLVLDAERMGDPSVFSPEPAGVFGDQRRVEGAMADDQVHHELQVQRLRFSGHALEPGEGLGRAGPIDKEGIQSEVIFDRVKALGMSGKLDGVEENPVETHFRGADQVRLPIPEISGERRKEVVDDHGGGDGRGEQQERFFVRRLRRPARCNAARPGRELLRGTTGA